MRHLVFAPFRNTRGEAITHSGCCRVGLQTPVNIEHLYSHAMGCKKAGNFTWRHDDIVKALFSLLKRGFLHGGELANRVTMEESLERQDGSGLRYQPDITLQVGGETRFIDVAVVDVACPTYLALPEGGSAGRDLAAAVAREEDKMADFRTRMSHVDAELVFVPFVVEITGRLGPRPTRRGGPAIFSTYSFIARSPRREVIDQSPPRVVGGCTLLIPLLCVSSCFERTSSLAVIRFPEGIVFSFSLRDVLSFVTVLAKRREEGPARPQMR